VCRTGAPRGRKFVPPRRREMEVFFSQKLAATWGFTRRTPGASFSASDHQLRDCATDTTFGLLQRRRGHDQSANPALAGNGIGLGDPSRLPQSFRTAARALLTESGHRETTALRGRCVGLYFNDLAQKWLGRGVQRCEQFQYQEMLPARLSLIDPNYHTRRTHCMLRLAFNTPFNAQLDSERGLHFRKLGCNGYRRYDFFQTSLYFARTNRSSYKSSCTAPARQCVTAPESRR